MKIFKRLFTLLLLLGVTTASYAEEQSPPNGTALKPPRIVDMKLFKDQGNQMFQVDFGKFSLEEFIKTEIDDEKIAQCFDQMLTENEDLKILVALKGGPIYIQADVRPRDFFVTECDDYFLLVKLTMLDLPQSPPDNVQTTGLTPGLQRLQRLLSIKTARAGDNFPGISQGGDFKPSGGVKVVITTGTIAAITKAFTDSGASCSFCTDDPFGGTGTSGTSTGSGTNTNTNTNTNTGGGNTGL